MNKQFRFSLLTLLILCPILISAQDKSTAKSDFVTVNNVRLHYLDWGGQGEALLFLHGMHSNANTFNQFAPLFTDRFRVLGLTRRGHGQSEKPEAGYDTGTLVEDIRQFLDAMKINRVHLVGHSMAGTELTRFASVYPKRVGKLVYLDAGYDFAIIPEAEAKDPIGNLKRNPQNKLEVAFFESIINARPDYKKVKAPALSFYAFPDKYPGLPADLDEIKLKEAQAFWDGFMTKWRREQVERFKKEVKKAKIIEMTNTGHNLFKEKRDEVGREMRAFLLGNQTAQNRPLIFRNVTLIDMRSPAPQPNMTIVISGNRVSKIGKNVKIPRNAETVDTRGKFLIPGLWDMHVHIFNNSHNAGTDNHDTYFPLLLANGVTGVRDMWTDPEDLNVLRDEAASWLNIPASPQRVSFEIKKQRFDKTLETIGIMYKTGVPILAGSDLGNPFIFAGFSLHDELELFVRAGLTPFEALQTATVNPAKYLGTEKSLGTIEKGKLADLVLLEGNPLEDIKNTTRIAGVVINGKYLPKSELEKLLAQVEAPAKK